jgi:hypothetical protein
MSTISSGPEWTRNLQQDRKGAPHKNLFNAVYALRNAPEWRGVLALGVGTCDVLLLRQPPWNEAEDRSYPDWLNYFDKLNATCWMQGQRINVSQSITWQAIQLVAGDRIYYPTKKDLESWACVWPGGLPKELGHA